MQQLILVMSLFMVFSLNAKEMNKSDHKGPEYLLKILQVSAYQTEEFLAIMQTQHEKRRVIHQQREAVRKNQRQAMKVLHQETIEKLSLILSDEQIEAFKALKRHKSAHKKGHRKMHDQPRRLD